MTLSHSEKAALVLFTGAAGLPPALEPLAGGEVEHRTISDLSEIEALDRPSILILTDRFLGKNGGARGDDKAGIGALPPSLVILSLGEKAHRAAAGAGRLFLPLENSMSGDVALGTVRAAAQHSNALLGAAHARRQLDWVESRLEKLNKVGMALMSERDPARLLSLILTQARGLTDSDAGSIYLMEEGEEGVPRLRFSLAQNDSLPDIPLPNFTLPVDETSLAGYAASTGEPLTLDDAYDIPEDAPYGFNRSFDRDFGYRAKSMLIVPMKDHHDRVVGVLQLINRKTNAAASIRDEASAREHVLPFGAGEVRTVQSLAGQAAVSIENGQLYRNIENLFEGFIKAAVTAIDQRDPATSGHSVRVATLTCDLAEVMDRADRGIFKDLRFSRDQLQELRYAGLLHDFGKVGVREEILVKAKKLPPVLLERIEARFDLIRQTLESSTYRQKLEQVVRNGPDGSADCFLKLEAELERNLERIDRFQQAVREANEPRILPEAGAAILQEIAQAHFPNFAGDPVPYLTGDEVRFLSISKGSLDSEERRQIESHVTFTYRFLREIPWTKNLSGVADIAHGHHEKIDGSGYPKGLTGELIPIQTRIMTVADIFDALTASDRPYKKSLPEDRALDILGMEAREGQLDPAVVDLLVDSRAYRRILEHDWREF